MCVEGSIIHGPHGSGRFDTFEGRPKRDLVAALCERADYVLAMGSCAAFGGIPAAPPNPSESTGLQYTNNRPGGLLSPEWRSRGGLPVINLSACPVDATTMIQTMSALVRGRDLELDQAGPPGHAEAVPVGSRRAALPHGRQGRLRLLRLHRPEVPALEAAVPASRGPHPVPR